MIRVNRGPLPQGLEAIRKAELRRIAPLVRNGTLKAKDFGTKYNEVRRKLWTAQRYKCCYCERRIDRCFNDVEHFRPKTRAHRGPGRPNHGYWWLAWTWENLLFACPPCNRKHKKNEFPLAPGSRILPARRSPPGPEASLLIDPSVEDPIDHIQFRRVLIGGREKWFPFARGGSERGKRTIRVLKLARPTLLTDYQDHFSDLIEERVNKIRAAMGDKSNEALVQALWSELCSSLFRRRRAFKALSYDILDHSFPSADRQSWGLSLRRP